jgi:predicted permease
VEKLIQDVRFATRILLKRPGFCSIIIVTLALGIGANTAIFSVTDKLLIRSLAVKDPNKLVLINSVCANPHFVGNLFSYPNFQDYKRQNQGLSGLIAFTRTTMDLNQNDQVERVQAEYVSSNYFDVLGVRPARGQLFSEPQEQTAGSQPVAVVSDGFWRKRFGSAPNLVGQTITLNGFPLTVIGITPSEYNGFLLEQPTEVWVPATMNPQLSQSNILENRKTQWLQMMGRIKDGVSQKQAEESLDILAQQVRDANTPPGVVTKGLPFSEWHMQFEPGGQGLSILRKRFSVSLQLLTGVVGLVLLIACTNVAGLLLARGVLRRKELAIRTALGAGAFRLGRQLLTESLLLALVGGSAGVLLAPWLVSLLVKTQSRLSIAQNLFGDGLDKRVLFFATLTTLLAGLLFGVVPALQGAKADLLPALKDDAANRPDRRFNIRSLLVVTQLALAVIVLIGAGLCIKSLRNLLAIDPGYSTENVLIVPMELDAKKYDAVRGRALQEQLMERFAAMPGVESVSNGTVIPLSGSRYVGSIFVEGEQPLPNEQMAFDKNDVGPGYFETMGIRIVKGRSFTEQDRVSGGAVIINEALAQKLFPNEDALGKRLKQQTNGPSFEIVGISANVKHHELTETPVPHFDLLTRKTDYNPYTSIVVRTKGKAAASIAGIRNEMRAIDSSLQVSDIESMSEQIGTVLAAMSLASTLVAIFGVVALLLAALGLYGVMAYTVAQRTREIGVRMALGAQVQDVISLVIRQGLRLIVVGVVLGLAASYALTRLVESFLYGVSPTDPVIFAIIALILCGVALLACFVPARRATRVDPMIALRCE